MFLRVYHNQTLIVISHDSPSTISYMIYIILYCPDFRARSKEYK